jgi:arginine decarboxylase
MFFTKGVGTHKEQLRSFEIALRDAGIEKYNLVHVSSILPPRCKIIPKIEGLKELKPGQIVFCVMARCASDEPNRLVAASIGCAIPADPDTYGYLSEHHGYGQNEKEASDYSEDLAASMLASIMGLKEDDTLTWNEQEQLWKMEGKILRTRNETQTAECKRGGWTTVVACAVLIF